MHKFFLSSFFILCYCIGFPQEKPNSTEEVLRMLKGGKKLDLLISAANKSIKSAPGKTVSLSRRALELATELKDRNRSAEACLLLSQGYTRELNPDSAMFFAKKSLQLFREIGRPEGIIRASNQVGMVNLKTGKTEMAEKIFLETFGECNRIILKKDASAEIKDLTAEVFNNLMLIDIQQGNYQKAKEKLLIFSKKNDYRKTYSGMIIQGNLSNIYYMLGKYDSALFYSNNSLILAHELNEPLNSVKIYTDMGNIYSVMGRYTEALNNYEKAKEVLLPFNDKQRLALLYNNMASVFMQIKYYEKATSLYLESVKLKEELNDSAGMAVTYNNIGLVYKDCGDPERARKYFGKAIAINIKKKNKKGLSVNFNGLGGLFLILRQADSALFYYRKSLEIKTEIKYKFGMVSSLKGIANVYSGLLMNDQAAFDYYEKALSIATEIGSVHEIAELNLSQGELLYKKKKLAEASDLFRKAFSYAKKENALDLIRKSSQYLTEISILTGEKDDAKDYFIEYRISSDSLFSRETAQTIMEMLTKYETEKKENENLLLIQDNENQKSQIRLLIVVFVLLLLLISVILYLYRQKSKAYRQIVQKNLEIVRSEKRLEYQRSNIMTAGKRIPDAYPEDEIEFTRLNLLHKFTRLMEEEKPYLDAGITLEDICRKISTNRTYLSQLINENYHQNFNSFINELRIREARLLLTEPKFDHISIEGIGAMAGFSSKVTFHSNFKQQIGVTPSYFRKSVARSITAQVEPKF